MGAPLRKESAFFFFMNDFLHRIFSHDSDPFLQFLKYAIVGGIATLIHVVVFFSLGRFFFPCLSNDDIVVRFLSRFSRFALTDSYCAISAKHRARNAAVCNVFAFLISNLVCYWLNRLFVFVPGRHSVWLELLLFLGVSAISIFIGTIVQTLLIARCKIQTSFAFSANLVASLCLNYVMRKFFIFNG